jgi:aconitate hydratase
MGILPLEFLPGQNADSLGLTGKEQFNIPLNGGNVKVNEIVTVTTNTGK